MPKIQVVFGDKRKCAECGDLKLLSDFSLNRRAKNGYYSYCKLCANQKNRETYVKFRNRILIRIKKYKNTKRGREVMVAALQKQRIVNRIKVKAREMVNHSLSRGKLIKPKFCEKRNSECSGKLHAHHSDYSKPLQVMWLCIKHHQEMHYDKTSKRRIPTLSLV